MAKRKKIIYITAAALAAVLLACVLYLNDNYDADTEAISAFGYSGMTVKNDRKAAAFIPNGEIKAGLIFYPGGKVDHLAYSPLMMALAEKGVLCIVPAMPFDLAVFDVNAADRLWEDYPQAESWYIGGHSLGGSMAAAYLEGHTDSFEGLVLLGSYSTADLSQTGLDVLSVYGSEDKVLNGEKYAENKVNLPANTIEYVIEGGNHAYFGAYGEQKGDGIAGITNKEQTDMTANAIIGFIG